MASWLIWLALATSPVAQEAVSLSASAAWGGHAEAGKTSEIGVTVAGLTGGPIRLNIDSTVPPVSVDTDIDSSFPRTVWIPFQPMSDGRVAIDSDRGGQLAKTLFETPTRDRLVAIAAAPDVPTIMLGPLPSGTRAIIVSAQALPRTAQAYRAVSALLIDASVFSRLDAQQTDALRAYFADCGRIVLRRFPPQTTRLIDRVAGCNGSFVKFAKSDDAIAPTLVALLSTNPDVPRGDAPFALDHAAAGILGTFAFLYACLILATSVLARQWWHFFLPPISAAILVYWAWTDRPIAGHAIVWSDMPAASSMGRYRAHLSAEGMGLGTAQLEIPSSATLLSWPENATLHRKHLGSGVTTTVLSFPSRLYEQHRITLAGAFKGPLPKQAAGETTPFIPAEFGRAVHRLPARGWLRVLPKSPTVQHAP